MLIGWRGRSGWRRGAALWGWCRTHWAAVPCLCGASAARLSRLHLRLQRLLFFFLFSPPGFHHQFPPGALAACRRALRAFLGGHTLRLCAAVSSASGGEWLGGPPGVPGGGGGWRELLLLFDFLFPSWEEMGDLRFFWGILTPLLRWEEAGFWGGDRQDTGGVRCRLGAAVLLSGGFGQCRGWASGAWFGLGSLSGSRQPDCLALASWSPVSEGWGGCV